MYRAEGPLEIEGIATGTPVPVSISGSIPVSGTVTVVQPDGSQLHVDVDSGTLASVTAVGAIVGALPAGANVIGHVIADSGSTTAVTGNVTAVQPTGTNLHTVVDSGHVVIDSGSTTVVTGNVTVVQPTGTNLHAVVDSGTITAVTGITNQVDTNLKQVGGTNTAVGGTGASAGAIGVGGTVATNVAITAFPLNLGAQAVSSENAAVTTARLVQLVADLTGKLIVLPYANPENFVSGAITSAMTGTSSTLLIAAPASGLRNYITQVTFSNAHATVGTDVVLQDGSGGTTLYTIPAAAVYGGAVVVFPTPLRQPTTATGLYCANVTTGASVKGSGSGYKGA